ncbi:ABC transporter substrate-binding protein [Paenibacillus fonticola]|uniref:ABC transporter substrate-binding protein n=1 Tax=Paenibacillus fonticola TaxID=379896 RepID=UPI0003607FDA|nr:ABC transporter substrate-binding protein [Paenibacillus fonticola]
MKKKASLILIATMIFSLILTACGGEQKSAGQNDASNGGDKKQVSFWYYFGGNEETALKEAIQKYNSSQDQYEVIGQYVPFGDMKKRLSVGLMGEELPDIVTVDNPDHASFAAAGIFEDITERVNEWGQGSQYLEGPLESAKYEGKLYGLPFTSNTLALFYNTDMFKDAGIAEPPKTWDELRETAKKLTVGDRYGLGFAAVKSEEGAFDFLPWLLSTGANYDSIDSPEAARAFTFLTDLIKDGSVSKEVINLSNSDTLKQFSSGKLAMMVNGPWNIAGVKADAPNMNFAIAKLPIDKQEASVLGGENIAVIKGNNVDGAWDFLRWMSEAEQMESYLVQTGYFSPRKDVAEKSDHWKSDAHLSGFLEQMQSAQPRGPHPKWPEISSILQEAYQKSFSMAMDPAAAAAEAGQKIKDIINP